jgi:NADH:ubiquinone oxidoreductase subunit 3 (subunit A)
MKLNLLFIVMDLLTILAYPIVFMYGKLRWFSKLKESIPLTHLLVPVAIAPDGYPIQKL